MDVVFIYGAQTGAYAASDTATALKLIRPEGGVIVWHDAPLYGVAPFLKAQMAEKNWPLRLIRDSTVMVGFVKGGQFQDIPFPLPRLSLS